MQIESLPSFALSLIFSRPVGLFADQPVTAKSQHVVGVCYQKDWSWESNKEEKGRKWREGQWNKVSTDARVIYLKGWQEEGGRKMGGALVSAFFVFSFWYVCVFVDAYLCVWMELKPDPLLMWRTKSSHVCGVWPQDRNCVCVTHKVLCTHHSAVFTSRQRNTIEETSSQSWWAHSLQVMDC